MWGWLGWLGGRGIRGWLDGLGPAHALEAAVGKLLKLRGGEVAVRAGDAEQGVGHGVAGGPDGGVAAKREGSDRLNKVPRCEGSVGVLQY